MLTWKGRRGKYFWAVLGGESPLLVQALPQLLQGRRVVITAFDSGEFIPTDHEIQDGWERRGRTAVSPRMVDATRLPAAGYDEWYVFVDTVPNIGDYEVFVNYSGFSPVPVSEQGWDGTWDPILRRDKEVLQARFWEQLERVGPWSFLAEGDLFTFITQSEYERDSVLKYWLEAAM